MTYENYGDKFKDYAKEKISEEVAKKIAPPVSRELVKFSDAALERGYKISYEVAEVSLPPKISRDIERQLRISTDRIKKDNADNLNEATVALITASTNTVFDVVSGDKNFDEASRVLASQAGGAVKTNGVGKSQSMKANESAKS